MAGSDPTVSLQDLLMGARLLRRLPAYLRNPIGPGRAGEVLRQRFGRRNEDFLALVGRTVYQNPASPYLWLLRSAGCEYGDLDRLISHEGIEGALRRLYLRGVYLTIDELKGRRPTVRGSASMTITPARVRNPRASVHAQVQSGGSRGAPTAVGVDLASLREEAADLCLWFDARGAARWTHAIWNVPGSAAVRILLRMCATGARPTHWFSQVDPELTVLHPRYRWSAVLIRWGARVAGVRLPFPRYVPLDQPLTIARWMAETLSSGGIPHLQTYPSAAVRLCQSALDAGLDLRGTQFILAGEPVTPARLAAVRRAGAVGVPSYSTIEAGNIGYGCLAPETCDDVHLLHDLHAVIQVESGTVAGPLPTGALLVTSLRPTSPIVLLNVSLGDQGTMTRRACGCPMERLGWTTHLHTIRSFEKLKAGGMTFLDTDVIRVLEQVLPARFGGTPTDYQLVEDEAEDGRPRLRLFVHPSVDPLDHDAVVGAFLAALDAGSGAEHVMVRLWRDGRFLGVERATPRTTVAGKIHHLHQE